MKQLTEAEAWRLIAKQFAGRVTDVTAEGLCYAAYRLRERGLIPNVTFYTMKRHVSAHLGESSWAYSISESCGCGNANCTSRVNDATREGRDARSTAALWLALEAEAGV